jgi:hypothetical protein
VSSIGPQGGKLRLRDVVGDDDAAVFDAGWQLLAADLYRRMTARRVIASSLA